MKKLSILTTLLCTILLVGCSTKKNSKEATTESSTIKSTTKSASKTTSQASTTSKEPETTSTSQPQSSEPATPQPSTATTTAQDLDIDAISQNNFATLAGTWQNGLGETLIINTDGTTNTGMTVSGAPNWTDYTQVNTVYSGKAPYAFYGSGDGAGSKNLFALLLLKIGFANPDGDTSDTSKPRILVTQDRTDTNNANGTRNFPTTRYFYKVK